MRRTEGHDFAGYVWIAPAVGLLSFILIYPLLQVVRSSFTNRTFSTPGHFVGADNYARLAQNDLFWTSFKNNLILLTSVPVTILVALIVSAALYRTIFGSRLYEFLILLPFLPSIAAVSVVFIYFLNLYGPLNAALRGVGLGFLAQPWLSDPMTAIWSVAAVMVWKRIGLFVMLFTARLLSLDRDTFEAAAIDGATWPMMFRQIAIPQMRSIIQFAVIVGVIEVFAFSFAYIFVLTQGGPFNSTYTLEFLLYYTQFQQQLVGVAAAVAVVLLVLVLPVVVYRVRDARKEGLA